jgi:hypothetical protein
LRLYATIRKVAGSIPDEVIGFFSIDLILPASNRNEYQESSWGIKGGMHVRPTTSLPSVSRLSRENVGASTFHNPMGLHGLYRDNFTFKDYD